MSRSPGCGPLVPPGRHASPMVNDDAMFTSHFSRRGLLTATVVAGAGAVAAPVIAGPAAASAGAGLSVQLAGDPVTTPRVNGLHLQFGADAAREIVVSWHTLQPVAGARVLLGGPTAGYERSFAAETRQLHRRQVRHRSSTPSTRRITGLQPGQRVRLRSPCTTARSRSSARSGPRRAAARRSRSPASATRARRRPARCYVPPAGVTIANPPFVNDNLGSPAAGDTPGRRRARAAAVPSLQRRPLLRQPGHRPGAHVVGLLGEQQRAARATGRGCRRPATTRTSAATGRSATRPSRPTSRRRVSPARPMSTRGLWYAFTVGWRTRDRARQRRRLPARTAATATCAATPAARRRRGWRHELRRGPRRPRHRLDRRVHAPGRDQHRRPVQRRRPGHPPGVAAAVRPVRRRPRRLRPRAPLRALAPDPRPAGERDADADPGIDPHRRDRHDARAPCTW